MPEARQAVRRRDVEDVQRPDACQFLETGERLEPSVRNGECTTDAGEVRTVEGHEWPIQQQIARHGGEAVEPRERRQGGDGDEKAAADAIQTPETRERRQRPVAA